MRTSIQLCCLIVVQICLVSSFNFTRDKMVEKGMYFPIVFSSEQPPPYFCYHFRKLCYGKFDEGGISSAS